jgi:hypothetical protein
MPVVMDAQARFDHGVGPEPRGYQQQPTARELAAWRIAPAANEDSDICEDCGHLPGCDCPHFCTPRGSTR